MPFLQKVARPRGLALAVAPVFACLVAILLSAWGCVGGGASIAPADDLLAGRRPSASSGLSHAERLTDGKIPTEGDTWRTHLTSVLASQTSYVLYDLGEPKHLGAALVQGDNNDQYLLSASRDGETFEPLWEAGTTRAKGMQTRKIDTLDITARYVRLSATGGDGSFSVGEVAVFSARPDPWPPKFEAEKGVPVEEGIRSKLELFALLAVGFILIHGRRSSLPVKLLAAIPAGVGISLAFDLAELWPFDEKEQTILRATIAAIAGAVIAREYFSPKKQEPPSPLWSNAALGILAALAIGCFYHFGMPQFRDEAKGRHTLVHTWDMRVYFPVAKYFSEIKFDGLYLASVAAYLDNTGASPASVGNARVRDLTNNEVKPASQIMDQVQAVRGRFSPARWKQFCADMRYFQDTMGSGGYLGSLADHGGNATPVWILVAHLLFRWAPANETTLSLAGMIDPIILGLLFYAMYRSFGLRVMLVSMIVFGTTDFSRFGTNLMGSTLRYDWMVAVGLAACALRTRRWALAGGLLAYGGLIRAFPAMAAFFLAAPAAWWIIEEVRAKKKLPSLAAFRAAQAPAIRAAVGTVVTVVALVGVSSLAFTYQGSWGAWIAKIAIHAEKPNVNHVGLRNLMGYEQQHIGKKVLRHELAEPWEDWQKYQIAAIARRKPFFVTLMLLFGAAAFTACRGRRLDQAALIGLFLIPILLYPANYYCHYIFLLPMIASRDGKPPGKVFGWMALVLLAMCVAQWFTLQEPEVDVCYTKQSWVLLDGFAAMLLPLAWFALNKRDEEKLDEVEEPAPPATGEPAEAPTVA